MLPPQLDEAQRSVVYHPRQQVEGHTVHVRAETIEHRDYLPGAALPRPPAPVVAPEIEEQLCFLLVAEYRQHPPSLVLHTQGLQLTRFGVWSGILSICNTCSFLFPWPSGSFRGPGEG